MVPTFTTTSAAWSRSRQRSEEGAEMCVCVMNGALGMDMDAEEGGDCDVCEVSPAAEETQVAASV